MTNNIVAVFACNINKEYPVVNGSIFNEEYNETLDSATIVLSQVAKEDRLSNIKPYDYVRVYDKSGNTGFNKLYLVDNFNEQENNIKEHIFGYTINLMSETKILEKIQCPNLVITHDIKNGVDTRKTILEKIYEYMVLYVPKMKYSSDGINWIYEPVIKFDGLTKNYTKHTEEDETQRQDERSFYAVQDAWECEAAVYITDPDVDINTVHVLDYEIINVEGYNPVEVSRQTVIVNRAERKISFFILCDREPQNIDFYISFSYEYFEYGTVVIKERWRKFDVPCADMGFNTPTLRQLLTTLMQQVGCIPIVKNRTLDFLDFQLDAVDFADNGDYSLGNTVNYIRRGLSSDSYVNSLVNISDNVLDSGNEVISETLCFRDKENVLLKQTVNLFLETSLPIYKINKAVLHAPGRFQSSEETDYFPCISSCYNCFYGFSSNDWRTQGRNDPICYYKLTSVTFVDSIRKITWSVSMPPNFTGTLAISNAVIHLLKYDSENGRYIELEKRNLTIDTINFNNITAANVHFGPTSQGDGIDINMKTYSLVIEDLNSDITAFWISGTFDWQPTSMSSHTKDFVFFRFNSLDPNLNFYGPIGYSPGIAINCDTQNQAAVAVCELSSIISSREWDITPLVVENSIRQLLERDFTKMEDEMSDEDDWTIQNLSKYVYGTVGYSIGSKKISGFSEVFNIGSSTALGWLQKDFTYIENIVYALRNDWTNVNLRSTIEKNFANVPYIEAETFPAPTYGLGRIPKLADGTVLDINNLNFQYYNPQRDQFSNTPYFTAFFVDLYYQPLNSFNLSYVKKEEEIDFPISQYNSNVSGLSDFDRLSTNEQEQVDRIGNEVLTINQRTNLYSNIRTFANGPLFFKDDTNRSGSIDSGDNGIKYIIFKRSFTIKNNFFNVTYVGSKDAVLKNYFTSIRTKYRAYQYVDYNQSVLRKERDTLFVRIASNYYNGDDKIWLGSFNGKNTRNISYFIYDISNNSTNSISYECERDVGLVANGNAGSVNEEQTVKNSVSLISTNNMMGVIYEAIDNVGAGPYIKDITNMMETDIGGIPQSWQIWGDSYNIGHNVTFISYIDFYKNISDQGVGGTAENVKAQIELLQRSPIISGKDNEGEDFSFVDLDTDKNVIFSVCDLNDGENFVRTFYKDVSERINHTVQFIYYSPYNEVLFGEDFISGTPMIARFSHTANAVYGSSNFEINTNAHETTDTRLDGTISTYIVGPSNNIVEDNYVAGESVLTPSDFEAYQNIFVATKYSETIPNEYDIDSITNITVSIRLLTGQEITWRNYEAHLDAENRRFVFTGTVDNFPSYSSVNTLTFYFTARKKLNSDNITVYWHDYSVIKLCHKNSDNTVIDIAVFKRPSNNSASTIFYFTLNDTKSDYVMGERNGILYRAYRVANNNDSQFVSSARKVKPL